jgi:Fur family ferric uptake transcriptional regulator
MDRVMVGPLAEKLERQRGFRMDIGHLALFGVCASCEKHEEKHD